MDRDLQLVTKKLKDIKPYERNPRKNDKAVEAVKESIRQCEYISPIVVDENNVILAGHTRYKALKEMGVDEIEVCVKSGLTEEQKKKYRILDNKTAELTDWDFDLLAQELDGLDFEGFDFGFGVKRIAAVKEYLTAHNWSDPETELKRRTGISTNFEQETQTFDISQVRYKERRASYSEGMDAKRHLAALKAYQEG